MSDLQMILDNYNMKNKKIVKTYTTGNNFFTETYKRRYKLDIIGLNDEKVIFNIYSDDITPSGYAKAGYEKNFGQLSLNYNNFDTLDELSEVATQMVDSDFFRYFNYKPTSRIQELITKQNNINFNQFGNKPKYFNEDEVFSKFKDENIIYNDVLEYTSYDLLESKEFSKKLLDINPLYYPFVFNEDIRNDTDIALNVLDKDPYMIELFNEELCNNKKIILKSIENGYSGAIQFIGSELTYDTEFLKECIEEYPETKDYIDEDILKELEEDTSSNRHRR